MKAAGQTTRDEMEALAALLMGRYQNALAVGVGFPRFGEMQELEQLLNRMRVVLFPELVRSIKGLDSDRFLLTDQLSNLKVTLAQWIHRCMCRGNHSSHQRACGERAAEFMKQLPRIRDSLMLDIEAANRGDPAAESPVEILLTYPGLFAVMVHRLAHALHRLKIPLLPRMMAEYSHSLTGIDIHPGAQIGSSFFIDHGTGVVIGETTCIGNHVKIYQSVTLGALSLPTDQHGHAIRSGKRHPTIADHVTIYAGATILGGDTVIGEHSVIGGNVWLTSSVPPRSKVINQPSHKIRHLKR